MNEKMIVACPVCGRQLLKSNSGTHAELSCPKCCSELNCSVNGATVSVEVVKKSQKQGDMAVAEKAGLSKSGEQADD